MTTAPYPVTGSNATGEVHPRLDIRDLVKKPEQFSLFIQAWVNIRNPKYDPGPAQHIQIGGIHGLPYQAWPGDPEGTPANGAWRGYCHHRSVLFPTWHRPYVLLMEQSICTEAQSIVNDWKSDPDTKWGPDPAASKKAWEQAANQLRFPYWDWTAPLTGEIGLPPVLYERELSLVKTDGSTSKVENILASYDFGSEDCLPPGFSTVEEENPVIDGKARISYYNEWTRTYRWPSSSKVDVKEDYENLNGGLTGSSDKVKPRGSYTEILGKVAQLFSYPFKDKRGSIIWDQFSNAKGQTKKQFDFKLSSLEQPHDTIHLVVGGSGGHMMDNDYAGFDPIFFLHHCNVDRILAFWEYVYPSYWIGKDGFETPTGQQQAFTQVDGTWSQTSNAKITELSKLEPYRKRNGEYWIANDTRFVGKSKYPKYYTYPPIRDVSVDKPATEDERAQHLRTLQAHFRQDPVAERARVITPMKQALFTGVNREALPEGFESVQNFRQFAITVEVFEHAFEGSHFLEIAYTSKDGKSYPIGATAILSRSHGTQCAACRARQHENSKVHDVIHIPHETVAAIIIDHDLNDPKTSDDTLSQAIRKSFKAHIVSPSGATKAEALLGVGVRDGWKPIDEAIRPQLRLASANACAIRDVNEEILHPWEYYDWRDHGTFLEDEWVVAA